MKKSYNTWVVITFFINLTLSSSIFGNEVLHLPEMVFAVSDTIEPDTSYILQRSQGLIKIDEGSIIEMKDKARNRTFEEFLTEGASGVYITQPSAEPGSLREIFVRGIDKPLLSARDIYGTQPLVVLDGVPLITDHPFAFDVQSYEIERIGPENNLLSHINLNDIERVSVRKDLASIALYGPLASNGVIELQSRSGSVDTIKRIAVNSYIGMAVRPHVTTINGEFENSFRKQFYDLYTINDRYFENDIYPIYLSDSLNRNYFGPSDWTDSYYSNQLNHGVDLSLSGGNERAKFHFMVGNSKTSGVADDTGLDKYKAKFYLSLKPFKNGLIETMINANRIDRKRNKNLKNRFALMGYLPDLSSPLAPNNELYSEYLKQMDDGFDKNFTNILQGYFRFNIHFNQFNYNAKFAADYNEGFRDLFYPSTLMEENNFASNYFGYNQRLFLDQTLSYDLPMENSHLHLKAGSMINWDVYKYNYAYAYKGVNDFIKLNLLHSDSKSSDFMRPSAFPHQLVYKFLDRTKHNLASFYVNTGYDYNDKYQASLTLRYDGSSNAQPTERWFLSPTLSLAWNLKQEFYRSSERIKDFSIRGSIGRLGSLNVSDDFAQGPNYTAQIGYTGNSIVPSYNGIAGLVRPYESGWVGYDIPWSYIDEISLGTTLQTEKRNFSFSLEAYSRTHKNQMLLVPSIAEYGYKYVYENGMDVKNMGIEVSAGANITKSEAFRWRMSGNVAVNENKLMALPRGAGEIIIGNRKLKVGERIDRYWLLENTGIYDTDSDVPVQSGEKRTYNGMELNAGDPIWTDVNGDNKINDADRKMYGNVLPKVSGLLSNNFKYSRLDLQVDFYFNFGRKILNEEMSNRFNFIENENANTLNSIKEITYWEKRGDYSKYPLYNPWSAVSPYQTQQTLFLENGSFVKLRNISLGYDATDIFKDKLGGRSSVYFYFSAQNILTLSPYSGRDPELVNIFGQDTGAGLPIPRTFSLGFTINF